jgi:signal transduction histidine kinase
MAGQSPPELQVAGEIARAFLTARQPTEVYRLALEKVAPLVGASFACVFLRDGESDLLRIVSAHNWPQRYVTYLATLRVRPGNGPTGRAVLNNEAVDVDDVFADPELEDWWESARELGFTSSIALPLSFEAIPVGAITFYFRNRQAFAAADRGLLKLVASQLAATAERAHLMEDLEAANKRLVEQNVALEQRFREAEEAKRLKNEFLANVSHELRTPLTAILGYAFLLREGVHGSLAEAQMETVVKIESAGDQLLHLIEGLLDLSSLKLGNLQVDPELCDAGEIARTAVEKAGTPPPGVALDLDLPADRAPIHTSPSLVLRVLDGLISNAMKFTTEGTITVRVRSEEPELADEEVYRGPLVVWEVADTGIGIDEANQELIFEEFRQADGSATRKYGGAGLGLAVARGVARTLGGDIRVESSPGEGATFRFSVPSSVVRARAT